MEEKRTGLFENGLIWFGAGVSIAEILTGTYLAPLGMGKGLAAIIVGHIIGCLMLFLAGVIGGKVRKSAMETVKMSFGQKGSILFAVLNVLQLVGWTAIMIYDGALAADGVMHTGRWIWCLVMKECMEKHHVRQMTNTALQKVNAHSFLVKYDGKEEELPFDYGFVCLGMRANAPIWNDIQEAFTGEDVEVLNIGDSVRARRIIDGTDAGRHMVLNTLERLNYL